MSHLQFELERQRRACKQRFRGTQSDLCTYCRKLIKLDMGRHVANYHLDLAQLWHCPVSWCTQWKGTPQDCVAHLQQAHAVPHTVRAASLGKWFPPKTVSREKWGESLQPHVSGVSMDILLFSERGAPLIHHYHVFGGGSAHNSLRWNYMIISGPLRPRLRLRHVGRVTGTQHAAVTTTSAHPREVLQHDADVDLPRQKSRQAVSPRKPDAPAIPVSSVVPKVDIYDGRPPISCRCGSSCRTFLVMRYHHRMKIALPVSPCLLLLHTCSPSGGSGVFFDFSACF